MDNFWQSVAKFIFNVSILLISQVGYLWYTTNRHRQADKFEKLQLRFRFWLPRCNLFSDPLRNRNTCLGHNPYYGNHLGNA